MINYFMSTNPRSWFTTRVVCVKMLMDKNEEIMGDVTLFDTDLKKRIEGKSEPLEEIKSEDDRIRALEEHLDLLLTNAEKSGIRGMMTELM